LSDCSIAGFDTRSVKFVDQLALAPRKRARELYVNGGMQITTYIRFAEVWHTLAAQAEDAAIRRFRGDR